MDTNSSQTTTGNGNGNGTLTIGTSFMSPVLGSTYVILPNPKSGSGSLTVTDGGAGDEDGLANGIIKISQVPKGKYVINQRNIPPGFFSLLVSTVKNVHPSHVNQTVMFPVVPTSIDLAKLPPKPIPSPSLNDNAFNKWTSSFSARIVSNTNSSIIINNVDQTPKIILAGSGNSPAISTSVLSESSVLLNTSFAPLTSGSTIINTIGLENYSLPNSTNVVSIIPTIVTSVSTSSGYIVATPPLAEVIPGQTMIIPVVDPLIPSFGGLKAIIVQSSPIPKPGINNTNWFVTEIENKIPPTISSNGINGVPILFIDLQHPFEENRTAFNWSNASNLAAAPTLIIVVNKISSSSIQKDSTGCPVVNAYTQVSGSWTTLGVREVSSKSVSLSKCEIAIKSQHLSKFAFSLKHLSSLTSDVGLSGRGKASSGLDNNRNSNSAFAISLPNNTVSNPLPHQQIIDSSIVQNKTLHQQITNSSISQSITLNADLSLQKISPKIAKAIKEWVVHSDVPTSDAQLLKNVGVKGQHIPPWVKKTTKWIDDGSLSQQDFLAIIKYLSNKEIIK
ncbi:MAG: hypothetical protein HY223_09550 [Thaumarchaeota archaeon]|nr:hypothetical protein [Nitrososphaerota archaeon]